MANVKGMLGTVIAYNQALCAIDTMNYQECSLSAAFPVFKHQMVKTSGLGSLAAEGIAFVSKMIRTEMLTGKSNYKHHA